MEVLEIAKCGCGGEARVEIAICNDKNGKPYVMGYSVICGICGTRTRPISAGSMAVAVWNKAMSKEQIEFLSDYATALQEDPGLIAKVAKSPNGKNGCCEFCGCELFDVFGKPEQYWRHCPQCGALLLWE